MFDFSNLTTVKCCQKEAHKTRVIIIIESKQADQSLTILSSIYFTVYAAMREYKNLANVLKSISHCKQGDRQRAPQPLPAPALSIGSLALRALPA